MAVKVHLKNGRKVQATILFLLAIMHRKVIHVHFKGFFLPLLAGPQFVEIQKFATMVK